LGNNLSGATVLRELLALDFVVDIPVLDIKQMSLDPTITGSTDGYCGRFLGVEDEVAGTCSYEYEQVIDKLSSTPLTVPDSTSGFRIYRAVVSLVSVVDFSTLTYTYEELYRVV
jgi:hypothetical protein